MGIQMPRLLVIYLEEIFFFQLFSAMGKCYRPNKEKEMRFNGVHKSVFQAANSKRYMLFRSPTPPLSW